MRNLLFCLFLLFGQQLFACECPPLSPLTKETCDKYSVIFQGKVDSVSNCSSKGFSKAYFTISNLFRGNCTQQAAVEFDCTSACMMNFQKGEEWIIYAIYEHFDELSVNLCSHSRKLAAAGEMDSYAISNQRSYEDELTWLKKELGTQAFIQLNGINEQQRELKPHNTQPSDSGKLVLLLISLLAMLIIVYFSRTKKK